jgi:hypothetical protein
MLSSAHSEGKEKMSNLFQISDQSTYTREPRGERGREWRYYEGLTIQGY